MKISTQIKILLIVIQAIVIYGFICPFLISYRDSILVFVGIIILIAESLILINIVINHFKNRLK